MVGLANWGHFEALHEIIPERFEKGRSVILTPNEIEWISKSPEGLELAMDYHDSQMCQGEAMGFDCSGNQKRYDELKAERDRLKKECEA